MSEFVFVPREEVRVVVFSSYCHLVHEEVRYHGPVIPITQGMGNLKTAPRSAPRAAGEEVVMVEVATACHVIEAFALTRGCPECGARSVKGVDYDHSHVQAELSHEVTSVVFFFRVDRANVLLAELVLLLAHRDPQSVIQVEHEERAHTSVSFIERLVEPGEEVLDSALVVDPEASEDGPWGKVDEDDEKTQMTWQQYSPRTASK